VPGQPVPQQPVTAAPVAQPVVQPVAVQPAAVQPVAVQPTAVQPAAPAAPVVYQAPAQPAHENLAELQQEAKEQPEVRIYSHSNLFYWWPVWAIGYVLALATYLQGQPIQIGSRLEWFHPGSGLGVVYFLALFLVVLITSVSVRGVYSGMVILFAAFLTVLFAYFGWWDQILSWLGHLSIHLNLGAYLFFSTLLFVVWAATVFVFDHMTFWRIKPGQITQEYIFGATSKSYDTKGMTLEKHRDELFRHWLLGLGSGDLRIHTAGANRDRIDVPNVLFVGSKVVVIQRMIALVPEAFGSAAVK
jgi:hypothetical protein